MIRPAFLRAVGLLMPLTCCGQALAATPHSPQAVVEKARELQATGNGEAARDLLRAAAEAHPESELLALARAEAYLADDNDFWALKVLQEYTDAHPPACQSRGFMARIHIDQANLDDAEGILNQPGCDRPEEIRARMLLLRAVIAQARDDHRAAQELVREAQEIDRRYEEDHALLSSLGARYDPHGIPLLSWRLDVAGGWTTNGLAGSPVDQEAPVGEIGSAIAVVDVGMRLVVPTSVPVQPTAEVQLKLSELITENEEIRGLSTRQPTLRAGAILGSEHPRLQINYAYNAVQVEQGDQYDEGPVFYSEAHRGEYELDASDSVIAFGGAGQRRFREAGRTRFEFEQGLAAAIGLSDSVRLMTGVSARYYRARNQAYHAVGATGLLRLSISLPKEFELRETLSLSGDVYPNSAGFFRGSNGRDRRENLLRLGAGVWTPSTSGLRAGLEYEYTNRDSTADAYSFTDYRTLLHVAWNYDSDRLGVSRIPAEGRVPMQHGVDAGQEQTESELQIRDLMRQDEAVQRGSSCLK